MSSFVCSDHTILAIVEGMRNHGMIAKKKAESRDMCEALRLLNEYQTCTRYGKRGEQVTRHMVERNHQPVTERPRKYSDGETIAAINCYLYQIDTEPLRDFDLITLVSAVKLLRDRIAEAGEAAGTMRRVEKRGSTEYFEVSEYGDLLNIYDIYDWDLAA